LYALDRRLSGPQSRSGRGGEEKDSQPLPGLEPQPVAQRYTTELSHTYVIFLKVCLSLFVFPEIGSSFAYEEQEVK